MASSPGEIKEKTDGYAVVIREPAVGPVGAAERRLASWLLPRAMLGSMLARSVEPRLVLAFSQQGHRLVGAAAFACVVDMDGPVGFPFAVHVVKDERRRGIGRALVSAAAKIAGDWVGSRANTSVTPGLVSWDLAKPGSEEAAGWTRLGFEGCRCTTQYRCDAAALLRVVGPIEARLRERGKVPAGVSVVPLTTLSRHDVLRLQSMHLGGRSDGISQAMERGLYSRPGNLGVVLQDGRLGGIFMLRWLDDTTVHVDSKVVAPGVRGSWVNTVLMHAALRETMPMGLRTVLFKAGERHRDTASLARRAGGEEVERLDRYFRALVASA